MKKLAEFYDLIPQMVADSHDRDTSHEWDITINCFSKGMHVSIMLTDQDVYHVVLEDGVIANISMMVESDKDVDALVAQIKRHLP